MVVIGVCICFGPKESLLVSQAKPWCPCWCHRPSLGVRVGVISQALVSQLVSQAKPWCPSWCHSPGLGVPVGVPAQALVSLLVSQPRPWCHSPSLVVLVGVTAQALVSLLVLQTKPWCPCLCHSPSLGVPVGVTAQVLVSLLVSQPKPWCPCLCHSPILDVPVLPQPKSWCPCWCHKPSLFPVDVTGQAFPCWCHRPSLGVNPRQANIGGFMALLCCKAQRVCVHQRIALYKSYLLFHLLSPSLSAGPAVGDGHKSAGAAPALPGYACRLRHLLSQQPHLPCRPHWQNTQAAQLELNLSWPGIEPPASIVTSICSKWMPDLSNVFDATRCVSSEEALSIANKCRMWAACLVQQDVWALRNPCL